MLSGLVTSVRVCEVCQYHICASMQVCEVCEFRLVTSVHQINARSPSPPTTLTDTDTKKQEHALFEGPYCQNVQKKN